MPNSYNLIEGDCGMTDIEKQANNYIQTSYAPERLNNKHLLPEITYEITKNIASYETGTKRARRIAELCLLSEDILSDNAVLNLYNKLKTRKRATEILTVLQNSQRIRRLLLLPEQDEDDLSKALKAFFDRGRLEMDICIIVPKTRLSMLDRVLLRDSQSNAPRFIAECAVVYISMQKQIKQLNIWIRRACFRFYAYCKDVRVPNGMYHMVDIQIGQTSRICLKRLEVEMIMLIRVQL